MPETRERRFALTENPIRCAHCRRPIEACAGAHGDWMHTGTRAEHCAGSDRTARPETVAEMTARATAERHARTARAARKNRRGGA